MSNKIKLGLVIGAVLLVTLFINIAYKDDAKEINKIVNSLNQPMTNIVHIEFLDNKKAIAFYEWGPTDQVYFGEATLKKGLFGWEFLSGATGQVSMEHKLDWGFSNLAMDFSNYTDLIRGKILDPEIVEVKILTKKDNEYNASIVEKHNNERFWFLITNGEDLLGSTITGLSSKGEIIEQITR
ncbi:hypothetical protein [Litchfieldia alkalitelluris]|uniref:hypothetical protein n=1 Tax=Litchfieldia alkalitelluris TaxID=304268 RepID=UPI000997BB28|nr:hypothetical protein [Litchfieldia alkalitelluris]